MREIAACGVLPPSAPRRLTPLEPSVIVPPRTMAKPNASPSLQARADITPSWATPLWTTLFLAFLISTSAAVGWMLYREGTTWLLLLALMTTLAVVGVEHLEGTYALGWKRSATLSPRSWAPFLVIAVVPFVLCFPTLNIYFLGDDFAYVRLFHRLSVAGFWQLFSTDLSQGAWGTPIQELRPLYALCYWLGSFVSGLHPLGYHLIGLSQHIFCSWMVFLIVKEMGDRSLWRAGFAGLLFAILPLHSEAVSWISGAFTEPSPGFFYLAAFWGFVCFRSRSQARYLFLSSAAFAACLLSKETAVTLPLTLLSYDLYQNLTGETGFWLTAQTWGQRLRRFALPYLPLVALLLFYLGMRRRAFPSYLREDHWGAHLPEALASAPAFSHRLAQLSARFWDLHAFNLRQIVISFDTVALGVILGLCLAWAIWLLRNRSSSARSMATIVYFGFVWYAIYSAPFGVDGRLVARHLYLGLAGPSIALAFLVVPSVSVARKQAGTLRLLGAVFLLIVCGVQLWRLNRNWDSAGKVSAKLQSGFVTALGRMPRGSLVIVSAPWGVQGGLPLGWPSERILYGKHAYIWGWSLPYALEKPFALEDHYSQLQIIEEPMLYCCSPQQWGEKVRRAILSAWQSAPNEELELHLLRWDDRTQSVEWKKRILAKDSLRAVIANALGEPLEAVESLHPSATLRLMQVLLGLFSDQPSAPAASTRPRRNSRPRPGIAAMSVSAKPSAR